MQDVVGEAIRLPDCYSSGRSLSGVGDDPGHRQGVAYPNNSRGKSLALDQSQPNEVASDDAHRDD